MRQGGLACLSCGARLMIRHVYVIGHSKTQDAECSKCYKRFTLLTQIVSEVKEPGDGARALAKKIAKRKPRAVG